MFPIKIKDVKKAIRKSRRTNFLPEEKETLLRICRKYQNTIECKQTDKTTWKEKENTWAFVEREYNQYHIRERRSVTSLKKKYESVKMALKKACEQQRILLGSRGYPFHPPANTTTEEEKLLLAKVVVPSLFGHLKKPNDSLSTFHSALGMQNENHSPNTGDAINDVIPQSTIKEKDIISKRSNKQYIVPIAQLSPPSYLVTMEETSTESDESWRSSNSKNSSALTSKRSNRQSFATPPIVPPSPPSYIAMERTITQNNETSSSNSKNSSALISKRSNRLSFATPLVSNITPIVPPSPPSSIAMEQTTTQNDKTSSSNSKNSSTLTSKRSNRQSFRTPHVKNIMPIAQPSPPSYIAMEQTRTQNNKTSTSHSKNLSTLTRKRLELFNLEISSLKRRAALMEEKHKMKVELMKKQIEHRQLLIHLSREKQALAVQIQNLNDEDLD